MCSPPSCERFTLRAAGRSSLFDMPHSGSPDVEKAPRTKGAEPDEHQAPSLSQRPRRSLLRWFACVALALLVFATRQTPTCGRLSVSHQEVSVHKVPVDDARSTEERLDEAVQPKEPISPQNHHVQEPWTVARRDPTSTSSAVASPTVLECFQVAPPVLTPQGASYEVTESDGSETFQSTGNSSPTESCTVLLMEHSFGYSYGMPFIGKLDRAYRSVAASWHTL